MQKKKIDVFTKYFYPVAAGIETNIIETYSVLAKKGWNINIHTSNNTYTEKASLTNREELRGLDIKRYDFGIFGFWPKIDHKNTDLVCLHNFDIFPQFQILVHVLYLKLIGRKKFALILTPHGGFNPEWRVFKPWQVIIKRTYHFTLGAWLINKTVDGVRAVSEWERGELIKKGIKKNLVSVIDNGLEDEAYADLEMKASDNIKQKVKGFNEYIIQIGRIYPIKNYETTIKALAQVPKNIKYVIVGPVADKLYLTKLNKLAKVYGVEERIIYAGVIRGVDKYYLIKHAKMMVHMAIWESYCNVVHEGMSQGLVCLVANNTALPLLIKNEKNGYVIESFDSQALAEKINHVLDNFSSTKIQNMRELNRQIGLMNSWKKVAGRMNEWYRELSKKYDKNNNEYEK